MEERTYNPIPATPSNSKCCGIYQLRNIINGKIYIGSSKCIQDRLRMHFWLLSKGKHENIHLQRAYNKNSNIFVAEIVETCSEDKQFETEQYWISRFYGENCYNISKDATRPPSTKGNKYTRSEEYLKKLSIATSKRWESSAYREHMSKLRKGKYTGKDSFSRREVVCLETGEIFDTIVEAAKIKCASASRIQLCCKGKAKGSGGFHWRYKEDADKLSKEDILKIISDKNNSYHAVKCLETGEIFEGIIMASKSMGISIYSISDCCRGKSKTAHGYHFVYVN